MYKSWTDIFKSYDHSSVTFPNNSGYKLRRQETLVPYKNISVIIWTAHHTHISFLAHCKLSFSCLTHFWTHAYLLQFSVFRSLSYENLPVSVAVISCSSFNFCWLILSMDSSIVPLLMSLITFTSLKKG